MVDEINKKRFLFMPEGCKWKEISAINAEIAYSSESCWYLPNKKIAIMDIETGETIIFTRELDEHGNLIKVNKMASFE